MQIFYKSSLSTLAFRFFIGRYQTDSIPFLKQRNKSQLHIYTTKEKLENFFGRLVTLFKRKSYEVFLNLLRLIISVIGCSPRTSWTRGLMFKDTWQLVATVAPTKGTIVGNYCNIRTAGHIRPANYIWSFLNSSIDIKHQENICFIIKQP